MSTRTEWARAYARQADAELRAWSGIQSLAPNAECQRLMLLQMACEKLTKAHLCIAGSNPVNLQRSHAYIAKNLPIILRQLLDHGHLAKNPKSLMTAAKHLAQEIELLAPAVKRDGQRPDNCEYPWEDEDGKLHSPLDWTFSPSRLLLTPGGRTFLKLLRVAITGLL